jgi:hypothetical protein
MGSAVGTPGALEIQVSALGARGTSFLDSAVGVHAGPSRFWTLPEVHVSGVQLCSVNASQLSCVSSGAQKRLIHKYQSSVNRGITQNTCAVHSTGILLHFQ